MSVQPYTELAPFEALIVEQTGLRDLSAPALTDAVKARMAASGCGDLAAYWRWLTGPASDGRELRALAAAMTVGETYFMRVPEQFRAFAEVALPERVRRRAGIGPLRVLSAGCASGEEAYTLAMVAREALGAGEAASIRIDGIDVHAELLARARRATYTEWSLRALPDPLRQRYFQRVGASHQLAPDLAKQVRFEERNLLDEDAAFWRSGAFDVIFFRNVSIYFTPEATRRVIARLARALAPAGYLFLGPAETLRGISSDFDLRDTHGTYYYQRKADTESPRPALSPDRSWDHAVVPTAWSQAIGQASRRIAGLAGRAAASEPAPATGAEGPHLAPAYGAYRDERYMAALALVEALPPAARQAPEALLLRGMVLATLGRFEEAEAVCRERLAKGDGGAGAHHVIALVREQQGQPDVAIRHHHMAIGLDPNFAMPHVHLGRLASRAGGPAMARGSWRQALDLLPQERPERVLLFGGGFGREALQAMCRTALENCGDAP
jgi:chemotaxis protein methyltransferase CheR